MVKSTSENALTNSQKKKPDRPKKKRPKPSVTVRRAQKSVSSPVRAVFLVGFMGAGKSSVGRALGQSLNWLFEDLDDRIERREHRSIAEIFRKSGESAFRQAEHEALREVLQELRRGGTRVIALGGGAFVQSNNAVLLKAAGVPTVFLDAPVEELWQRCCRQATESGTDRPLLRSQDQFRELHRDRRKSYRKASVRIETGGRPIDDIAAEIVRKLRLKKITIRNEQGEVE
ncbi:MAG TPA: shikimate kinase [Candidatus Sulfotelmatobacter sp.]|nr:shikimate kinase [Candidatus Sulfotelmatobacter sp.]